MAYILTLLAAVGLFFFSAPIHTVVVDSFHSASESVESITASGSAPLMAHLRSAVGSVREKAMKLLREELHHSVDDLVQ